jgi:alcohol dehydrogenase YqhD (iron-dependent ADH family)
VKNGIYDNLIEQAKSIDLEKIDFSGADFKPRAEITEKQKVFFWIKLWLHDEIDIKPDTDVTLKYLESVKN